MRSSLVASCLVFLVVDFGSTTGLTSPEGKACGSYKLGEIGGNEVGLSCPKRKIRPVSKRFPCFWLLVNHTDDEHWTISVVCQSVPLHLLTSFQAFLSLSLSLCRFIKSFQVYQDSHNHRMAQSNLDSLPVLFIYHINSILSFSCSIQNVTLFSFFLMIERLIANCQPILLRMTRHSSDGGSFWWNR